MDHFLLQLCILFLLFAFATSYASRQSVGGDHTILQLLEGNATSLYFDNDGTDFDVFSYLFAASSRSHRLEENIPGDITVFAPDDNAFRRAIGDLGLKTTSELETYENFLIYLMNAYRYPFDVLTRILYYHVIRGEFNSTTALSLPSFLTWDARSRITLEGTTLVDQNPELPNPNFSMDRMDIRASNGIVHVIDYVLFPEVMRKIDFSEIGSDCSTPEATLEDSGVDGGIGPLPGESAIETTPAQEAGNDTRQPGPQQDALEASPIDDPIYTPVEPRQTVEDTSIVTTLELDIGVIASPLPPESSPQEEDVIPFQEITEELSQTSNDDGEPQPSLLPQTLPDIDALESSLLPYDVLESETPLEEEIRELPASASPNASPNSSQEGETTIGAATSPEFFLESKASSGNPTDPDISSDFEMDDDSPPQASLAETPLAELPPSSLGPTPFPNFSQPEMTYLEADRSPKPSPEQRISSRSPISPQFSPEIVVGEESPPQFSLEETPLPELPAETDAVIPTVLDPETSFT